MKLRILAMLTALCIFLLPAAFAVEYEGYTQEEFDALEETTVIASPDSPSGYFVTFRYKDPDAARVRLYGEWLLSDREHALTNQRFSALDWQDGCFPMGSETFEMVKNEETGVWSFTLPLGSGTWSYRFYLGGEDDSTRGVPNTCDPANPPFSSVENDTAHMSQVYVPFGPGLTKTNDRSAEAPRDGENGEKSYVTLTTGIGEETFALYVPYGYDANRAEPYPLIVLMHGSGGDETDWLTQGATANIMDNLIADGKTEPALIVMPNGSVHGWGEDTIIEGYESLMDTILNYIIPYMETNYNVAKDADKRAITGLSRGGRFTCFALFNYTDQFKYYGAQSGTIYRMGTPGGAAGELTPLYEYDLTDAKLKDVVIDLESGLYDGGFYTSVKPFFDILNGTDVQYTAFTADGAHNWYFWRQALEYLLTEVFWK